jgi:hypothetical protein
MKHILLFHNHPVIIFQAPSHFTSRLPGVILTVMDKKKEQQNHDLMLLHSAAANGEAIHALRSRPGRLDLAELRPLKNGQDVSHSEVVNLKPHKDMPNLCDVDVLYSPKKNDSEKTLSNHAGPPAIATEAYRKNWNRVFSTSARKKPKNPLLN